jgi:hypothetical protein
VRAAARFEGQKVAFPDSECAEGTRDERWGGEANCRTDRRQRAMVPVRDEAIVSPPSVLEEIDDDDDDDEASGGALSISGSALGSPTGLGLRRVKLMTNE